MVEPYLFGKYRAFRIVSGDLELRVWELGATLLSLKFCGQECVLGYATPEAYEQGEDCIGAIVGRYANRIAGGKVNIGGRPYFLDRNDGENHLHGGNPGFHRKRWEGEAAGENAVRFTLCSPAGEGGYPGRADACVTYRLGQDAVRLDLEGRTDAQTLFAPTTHTYFNLGGKPSALDTLLQIHAEARLPVDGALIPTGQLLPPEGRYDFSAFRPIGGYYDDCFVLRRPLACVVRAGGIEMELWTDYPALQLYTGEYLHSPHAAGQGFALEPEFYPDSPHHPEWPQALLHPGERFEKFIEYHFRKKNG